jgi:hypothetical protein
MTSHSFDDVRLLIYKKNDNYKEALELFLDDKSVLLNKEENIFQFINMTFYNLNLNQEKTGSEAANNFKKVILKNLDLIGAKSIENFELMISTWFSKEKKQVLDLLKNNTDIQLKYVELLVQKLIKEIKDNQLIDFSEMKEDEEKYIKNFLILHIRLLCMKKEYRKIITYFKQCEYIQLKNVSIFVKTMKSLMLLFFFIKK